MNKLIRICALSSWLLTPLALGALGEDASEPVRGLQLRTDYATAGYTLISPLNSKEVLLLDLDGEVAHRWKTEHPPGGGLYLLDNGHLLYGGREDKNPTFHGGGIGGYLQEIDWDGNVVWHMALVDEQMTAHHDVAPLENGNILVIAWESRTAEEAAERGRDPKAIGKEGLWPDMVLEIEPTQPEGGEVVWEWHVWDHLIQDFDPSKPDFGSVPDHPERIDINGDHRDRPPITEVQRRKQAEIEEQMRALGYLGDADDDDQGNQREPDRELSPDWLHTNGIDYHPEFDLIVLSPPRMNELWVIDHSTTTPEAGGRTGGNYGKGGDLLYRYGNPRNYGAGDDSDKQLFFQHNPEWVRSGPTGELRLTVYNNGAGRKSGDFSSVDELILPFDPEHGFLREPGQPFGPDATAWSYRDQPGFFSSFISGAQRLRNGNTLICEGAKGRIFEVTPDQETVWDYLNPFGGEIKDSGPGGNAPPQALFRATRIAPDHPGLSGRLP